MTESRKINKVAAIASLPIDVWGLIGQLALDAS